MASKISLGIIIGAALDGSVGSAFGNASRQAQQLGEKLARIRLARDAGAEVQRLTTQLAQLRTQQQQTGASDTALAADINRVEQELEQARQAAQRLGLELHDLAGENQRLGQSEERLARQLQRRQQLDNNCNRRGELMGETMGVLALGAAFLVPIRTAMNFESKMAELGATIDDTTVKLAAQARQMGRDTKFSALEAADAQIALAKAGMNAQNIMAATPTVLSIAAASHMELGETAELTAEIMHGYGIKMEKMSHVSDILVKTANLSTTSVQGIGESLKYVGGVASAVNVSFEQTNGMLATLSNRGIKGSQAGTALRMGFIRLAVAPKKAKKALEELGIAVADANGNFRDMPTILKEMDKATSKMGDKDRLGAYAKIFGVEASTAFLQLGKAASDGQLGEMITNVSNSEGAAKKMADTMNNTTTGAVKLMMSSFSELGIVLGNVLLPSITSIALGMTNFLNDFSVGLEKFPVVTGFIVKTSAALFAFKVVSLLAKFGWTLLSDALIFGKAAFDFFRLSTMRANAALVGHAIASTALAVQQKALAAGTAIATAAQWLWNAAITANPIGLLIIGVAALAVAVVKYWEPIKAFTIGLWDGIKMGLAPVLESLAPLQPLFSAIGSALSGLISWIGQLFMPLNATSAELSAAGESGRQFGMVLGSAITALISVVGTLAQAFLIIGTVIGQAVAIGVGYFSQLMAAGQSLVSGFATIGSQIMEGLLGGLSVGFANVKARVSAMASEIKTSFQGVLGIHSPSRVFAELGGFINQGLQIGLAQSSSEPIGESVKTAQGVTRAFINQGLQIGLAQSSSEPIGESVKTAQGVTRAFDAGMDLTGATARPPAPSQGAAVSSSSAMSVSITINQLAGENSEDLANRIIAKIEQRQQLLKRGKLHD
jgi:TP901 family phage tail tape measure protein